MKGKLRYTVLSLLSFTLFLFLFFSSPSICLSAKSVIGIWGGIVQQPGSKPYSVIMKIESLTEGETSGNIKYPELKCGGSITYFGTENNAHIFFEKMEFGRNRCSDGGEIRVKITKDGNMTWIWYYPNGKRGAYTLLKPIKDNN